MVTKTARPGTRSRIILVASALTIAVPLAIAPAAQAAPSAPSASQPTASVAASPRQLAPRAAKKYASTKLAITVRSVPAGAAPALTVTGSGGFSRTAGGSVTYSKLAPGTYRISAASVPASGGTAVPSPSTKNIKVKSKKTSRVTISYSLVPDSVANPPATPVTGLAGAQKLAQLLIGQRLLYLNLGGSIGYAEWYDFRSDLRVNYFKGNTQVVGSDVCSPDAYSWQVPADQGRASTDGRYAEGIVVIYKPSFTYYMHVRVFASGPAVWQFSTDAQPTLATRKAIPSTPCADPWF
ncbi:MAG: hypothetical protein WCP28_12065 [Actinomycetes bacterium]